MKCDVHCWIPHSRVHAQYYLKPHVDVYYPYTIRIILIAYYNSDGLIRPAEIGDLFFFPSFFFYSFVYISQYCSFPNGIILPTVQIGDLFFFFCIYLFFPILLFIFLSIVFPKWYQQSMIILISYPRISTTDRDSTPMLSMEAGDLYCNNFATFYTRNFHA